MMQHYANGGAVQIKTAIGWIDLHDPDWADIRPYRIKPEPEYAPLEAEDWIKDGPWWVCGNECEHNASMVIKVQRGGVISFTGSGLKVLTNEDLAVMKRRNSTSDWRPCRKEKK